MQRDVKTPVHNAAQEGPPYNASLEREAARAHVHTENLTSSASGSREMALNPMVQPIRPRGNRCPPPRRVKQSGPVA